MITTVTLSPCIDKTVELPRLIPDKVNRVKYSRYDAGGKGVNVTLALSALGTASTAIVLNFDGGDIIIRALDKAGAGHEEVKCPGRIRTNLKIFETETGKTVELNEQNPVVGEKYVSKLIKICRMAAKNSEILVLSGSIPPGVPENIFKMIAEAAKAEKPDIRIVLDAEGEPFLKGLEAAPYLIKPNVEELERTFGTEFSDEAGIIESARKIIKDHGVKIVLVSMGDKGAVAVTEKDTVRARALPIEPKSAQGAGDAMVAGACFAIRRGLSVGDILRCGTCAAAGAVELEGTAFCSRERFEELFLMI